MSLRRLTVNLVYFLLRGGVRFRSFRLFSRFWEEQNLIGLLSQLNIECVLDVGANKGFYAKHLRMLGFKGRILCFEPIQEDAELIRAMSASDEMWSVYNFALGSSETEKEFRIIATGDETVLSSFLTAKERPENEQLRMIKIRRLDTVVQQLVPEIKNLRCFLKCDTQGYDIEVIKGAGEWLSQIVGLQSEVSVIPIYDGMPHYIEALSYYERLGFSLFDFNVVNRADDGAVLEYDCLMAKRGAIEANS